MNNQKFGMIIFLLLASCFGIFAVSSCKKINSELVVKNLIDDCPAWLKLESTNSAEIARIQACLKQIATYDTGTIKQAVKQYVDEQDIKSKTNTSALLDAKGKIFLLNRYLFNGIYSRNFVPEGRCDFRQAVYGLQ